MSRSGDGTDHDEAHSSRNEGRFFLQKDTKSRARKSHFLCK